MLIMSVCVCDYDVRLKNRLQWHNDFECTEILLPYIISDSEHGCLTYSADI